VVLVVCIGDESNQGVKTFLIAPEEIQRRLSSVAGVRQRERFESLLPFEDILPGQMGWVERKDFVADFSE
jgi:hypothetical protein